MATLTPKVEYVLETKRVIGAIEGFEREYLTPERLARYEREIRDGFVYGWEAYDTVAAESRRQAMKAFHSRHHVYMQAPYCVYRVRKK